MAWGHCRTVNVSAKRKTPNREVFEGSDILGLRLRAAKKPAVIPFLEIPPEEIDIEPITLDPVDLTEAEPISISPLTVPMEDILPYEDDDEEEYSEPPKPVQTPTPEKTPSKVTPKPTAPGNLSLFGVGEIETKGKSRRRS